MDNFTLKKKTINIRETRYDRFIQSREYLTDRRKTWYPDGYSPMKDILDLKSWGRRNYINHLDKSFGLEEETDKNIIKPWPCNPRKKSYLSSADSVLDLPLFSLAKFPEMLDWGNGDILVAALGIGYHKWSWEKQQLSGRGFTSHQISCCKFDPRGELLLLGTELKLIEVHDNETNKLVTQCICSCTKRTYCSIATVDWSPTGNAFVTGCTAGTITSFTRSASTISFSRNDSNLQPICSVRISPDARYVAMTAENSSEILIATWPYLKLVHLFQFENSFTQAICWHPWRSALLGRCATRGQQAQVAMCCVPSGNVVSSTLAGDYTPDTLLFSDRTGELVMSLFDLDRSLLFPKSNSRLVVLSDMKTVVDEWKDDDRTTLERVKTMVFSPDGTKLATATSEEDLIIWNFLPENKYKKKFDRNKFSAMPVYLDSMTPGCAPR